MYELLKRNIALIGMPACGKSTVGVLAAKALNMSFVDTDLLVQQKYGKLLWELLEDDGIERFIRKESDVVCSLDCVNTCIATGGSVVYSEKTMEYLKKRFLVIHLDLSYEQIKNRIADIKSRGVVIDKDKSLLDVYHERKPLYKRYADVTIQADKKSVEELVEEITSLFYKTK